MTVEIDKTTIKTFQGDTCPVTFTGLTEGDLIGFGVRDRITNQLVFEELKNIVDSEGEVTFTITPEMSNKFVVDPKVGINTYYYGIKQIDTVSGEENTILLGDNSKSSDKYIMKVFIKKVEGNIENG